MIRAREDEDGDERRDEEDHEERWENSLNPAGDEIAQLEFSGINISQDDFGDQEAREDKEDVYSKVAQRKPTFVR
jgi:hypothetical protein